MVAAIRRRHPDWRLWGVGGERMAAAGCDLWQNARDWAVMGFAEVLRSLPKFRQRLHDLHREIVRRRPKGVILIDFPGFNLKLARRLHQSQIDTLYYIVPQIWAWGQKRVDVFRRCISRTIVVFPFERDFFAEHGVGVDWVGHPLVDWVRPSAPRVQLRDRLGIAPSEKLVAMLPGSRVQDFDQHLPLFTGAVKRLGETVPGVRWALGLAPSLARHAEMFIPPAGHNPVTTAVYDLITAADVVLTKSGTATVECALLGTPMVCAFRTGALNFAIGRRLVKVPFIAMPNLIAGRQVVPEYVQSNATPETLSAAAEELLLDSAAAQEQRAALAEVRGRLGPPGAVERAADVVDAWLRAQVTVA